MRVASYFALAVLVFGASALPAFSATSLENGRAIYMTGRDLAGKQIAANPHPLYPSCAACHLPSGAGGRKLPGIVSADLRHAHLVHLKPPYTLALIERAISKGIDNEGKPLDTVMPRWNMSQADLHDVATYVLTQLK